ncbi:MAG TPA: carboxypeptidase-like regulatory domain-containing protein, partial [Pirellulales bacterium]|nr:carboxypeptidase-like regulatory domain-containing protein [Pirellulales bacterium]
SVVYYGKPVTSATITLEGTSIAPVKTDRQGRFLIRNVPVGAQYHVVVEAVARNYHREKSLDVAVEADGAEQPFLTIDVK